MLATHLGRDRVQGLGFVNFAAITAIVDAMRGSDRLDDMATRRDFGRLIARVDLIQGGLSRDTQRIDAINGPLTAETS